MFYPPRTEAPGHSDTLEKHEEQQTHSTRGVLIKQLEHVDSSLEIEMFIVQSTSFEKSSFLQDLLNYQALVPSPVILDPIKN